MSTVIKLCLFATLLCATLFTQSFGYPKLSYGEDMQQYRSRIPMQDYDKLSKRDEFTSKGWGAGGMPFSVLYMYPHSLKASPQNNPEEPPPKAQALIAAPKEPSTPQRVHHPKSVPQVRAQIPHYRSTVRRPYSVIPQLFVSYGWGPLGK